jgi:RNA recognition motif-containing protein
MNILIRNLTRSVTEKELFLLFQPFGEIKSYNIVTDETRGQSKGFGFVEMPERDEASAAIKALNGKLVRGQKIRVKVTSKTSIALPDRPRNEQPERFEGRQPKQDKRPAAKNDTRKTTGRPTGAARGSKRPSTPRPARKKRK